MEQKLKALKSGSARRTSTALSGYYQLCQRETSNAPSAQQLLADPTRRNHSALFGSSAANCALSETQFWPSTDRAGHDVIDYLRRQTSTESLEKSVATSCSSGASTGANLATRSSATLKESSTPAVSRRCTCQLSRSAAPAPRLPKLQLGGGGAANTRTPLGFLLIE
uniref:Uncharacterized protein n=1 Tax=Macrostomum lignano TaxID=282301 RepID=A0A1I8HW42_9PLAT